MGVPGEVLARDFLKLEARKQQIEVLTWRSVEEMRCRHTVETVQRAASLSVLDRRFKQEEGERLRTLERNQLIREQACLYQRQVGAQVKIRSEPGSVRSEAMEKIRDSRDAFAVQVEKMSVEWHKAIEDQVKSEIKKARDDTSHCLLRQNELLQAAHRQEQLLEELFAERERMQEARSELYAVDKQLAEKNQALRDRLEQKRDVTERSVIASLGIVQGKDESVEKSRSVIEQPGVAPVPMSRTLAEAPERSISDPRSAAVLSDRTNREPRLAAAMQAEAKPYVPRKGTRQFEVYQRLKAYEMEMASDLRLLEGMPSLSALPDDIPKRRRRSPIVKTTTFETETRAPVVYMSALPNQPQVAQHRGTAWNMMTGSKVIQHDVVEQSPTRTPSRFDHVAAEVHDLDRSDHALTDIPDVQHRVSTVPTHSNAGSAAAFQLSNASPPTFDLHAPIPSLSDMENMVASASKCASPKHTVNVATIDGQRSETLKSPTKVVIAQEKSPVRPGSFASELSTSAIGTHAKNETIVVQPHWPYSGTRFNDPLKDELGLKIKAGKKADEQPLHAQVPPITPFSPSHSVDFGSGEFHISSSGEPNLDNWIPSDVAGQLSARNPKGVDATLQSSMSISPGEFHGDFLSPPMMPGVGINNDNSVLGPQAVGALETTPSFLRPGMESSMGEVRHGAHGVDTLSFSQSATNTAEGSFFRGVSETSPEMYAMHTEAEASNLPIISNADVMKGFGNDVQVRAEDLRSPRRGEGQTSARSIASSITGENPFRNQNDAYFQKMETTPAVGSLGNRNHQGSMLANNVPRLPESATSSNDIGGQRPWQSYDTRPVGWSRTGTPTSTPSGRGQAESSDQRGRGLPHHFDIFTPSREPEAESPMSTDRRQDEVISAIARADTMQTKSAELPKTAPKQTPWASDGSLLVVAGKELDDNEIDDSDDAALDFQGNFPLRGGRLGAVASRKIDAGLTRAAEDDKETSKQPQASRPNLNSFEIGAGADELSDSEDAFKRSQDALSDDGSSYVPKVPRKKQNPLGRGKAMARSSSQTSDEFGKSALISSSPAGATKGYAASLGKALSRATPKASMQRSTMSSLLGPPIDWSEATSFR
mmetsp:Transcript_62787/g.99560  ORF Transcript_62787/g.99560 Transcript_62787/m.99560 type:complete len:1106 (-) Transcript_62787:108-3425(-)